MVISFGFLRHALFFLPGNFSRRNLRIFLTGRGLFECCQINNSNWAAINLETLSMRNLYCWSKQVPSSAGGVCNVSYKDC